MENFWGNPKTPTSEEVIQKIVEIIYDENMTMAHAIVIATEVYNMLETKGLLK